MPQSFTLNVNGKDQSVAVEPDSMLLYALRNNLGLHGPKFGCGLAECGACTVVLDGNAIRSCSTPVSAVGQAKVITLEGLGTSENPHPLLSRTLHEEVTFDRAHVTSRDWTGYPILRFSEIPDRIDLVLVNNRPEYPSYGAGEPATCPTAAVISNAVFDAIGVRLRQTPFRPEQVKAAMTSI